MISALGKSPESRSRFLAPVAYAWWEVVSMRLGFAVLLWTRLPPAIPWSTQPEPNGLTCWVDLTFLANLAFYAPMRWIFLAMLAFYVGGRLLPLALPYLLFVNVAFMTLGNSQGWIGHTDQIVSLVLLVQTGFYLLAAARRLAGNPWQPALGGTLADLEIYFSLQTIAATYVVAGLTKLIHTSGTWFAQLPNIAVQIVKTNDQFFYDALSHPNPGVSEWLNALLMAHPWLAYPLFSPGLLLELGSLFILVGRKSAALIGLALLGLHGLIHVVMQITFTTNISLIVIFLLNLPYWVVTLFRWMNRKYCSAKYRKAAGSVEDK